MTSKPPIRRPAVGLTLRERRILEIWESSGSITEREIAARICSTQQAVSRTLRRARLKKYGSPDRPVFKTLRLVSLSLFAL